MTNTKKLNQELVYPRTTPLGGTAHRVPGRVYAVDDNDEIPFTPSRARRKALLVLRLQCRHSADGEWYELPGTTFRAKWADDA